MQTNSSNEEGSIGVENFATASLHWDIGHKKTGQKRKVYATQTVPGYQLQYSTDASHEKWFFSHVFFEGSLETIKLDR